MSSEYQKEVNAERKEAFDRAADWGEVNAGSVDAPEGQEGSGAGPCETDAQKARPLDDATTEYEPAAEALEKLEANAIGEDV